MQHCRPGPAPKKEQKTWVPTSPCQPVTGMRLGGEGGEATPIAQARKRHLSGGDHRSACSAIELVPDSRISPLGTHPGRTIGCALPVNGRPQR
jgi:hypothetical protein